MERSPNLNELPQPYISEEFARANLSRGLAGQLIAEALGLTPPDDILSQSTTRSGKSLTSISRQAAHMMKRPGCLYAAAQKDPSGIMLHAILRKTKRQVPMRYIDRKEGFEQDLVRYLFLCLNTKTLNLDASVVTLSYHTIQRWIERGGGGDPRVGLLKKLDLAIASLGRKSLFDECDKVNRLPPRPVEAGLRRFGVPSADGGIWVAGLSIFSNQNPNSARARVRARQGSSVMFLTYLGSRDLSKAQAVYREIADQEGLAKAAERWPDMFIPEVYDLPTRARP